MKINGSAFVVLALSAENIIAEMKKDVYANGEIWDMDKIQIIPVSPSPPASMEAWRSVSKSRRFIGEIPLPKGVVIGVPGLLVRWCGRKAAVGMRSDIHADTGASLV
jgi:hypothetical protein